MRDEEGKRIKIPADMKYADWKAVYIDKSKTFDEWRIAKDAEYAAKKSTSSLRQSVSDGNVEFDLQKFSGQRLPEGDYNLKIRRQVQNRHIEGTREYQDYASRTADTIFKPSKMPLGIDAQALVNEFHGKGIYKPNPQDNSPREVVDTGRIIGQYWNNRKNQFIDTTWLMIVYAKSGSHIYPTRPMEEVSINDID